MQDNWCEYLMWLHCVARGFHFVFPFYLAILPVDSRKSVFQWVTPSQRHQLQLSISKAFFFLDFKSTFQPNELCDGCYAIHRNALRSMEKGNGVWSTEKPDYDDDTQIDDFHGKGFHLNMQKTANMSFYKINTNSHINSIQNYNFIRIKRDREIERHAHFVCIGLRIWVLTMYLL